MKILECIVPNASHHNKHQHCRESVLDNFSVDIGAAWSGSEILSELDTSSVTSKSAASRFDSVSSDLVNYEAQCRGLRLISEDGLKLTLPWWQKSYYRRLHAQAFICTPDPHVWWSFRKWQLDLHHQHRRVKVFSYLVFVTAVSGSRCTTFSLLLRQKRHQFWKILGGMYF